MTKCLLGLATVLAAGFSLAWAEQDILYDVKVISARVRPAETDSVLIIREDTLKHGGPASRITDDSLEFTWQHAPSGMTLGVLNRSGEQVTLVWDSSMASAVGGRLLEILPCERGMEYSEDLRAPSKKVRSGKQYKTEIATLARNDDGSVQFLELLPYPKQPSSKSNFEEFSTYFTTTKHFLIVLAIQREKSLRRYSFTFAAEDLRFPR